MQKSIFFDHCWIFYAKDKFAKNKEGTKLKIWWGVSEKLEPTFRPKLETERVVYNRGS